MTVYSLCPFFNELDVLEIRLAEQDDAVDWFCVVEAGYTYKGSPKPFHLAEHWERFAPWHAKLRYLQLDEQPPVNYWPHQRFGDRERWARENWQRSQLQTLLYDLEPDDTVMLSDCDEVVRAGVIDWYDRCGGGVLLRPELPMMVGWLNTRWQWTLPVIARLARGSMLLPCDARWNGAPCGYDVEALRHLPGAPLAPPTNAADPLTAYGWHFSYLGGPDAIRYKIAEAAHPELERDEHLTDAWLEAVLRGEADLFGRERRETSRFSEEHLPDYVRQHRDRFAHLIYDPDQPAPAQGSGVPVGFVPSRTPGPATS